MSKTTFEAIFTPKPAAQPNLYAYKIDDEALCKKCNLSKDDIASMEASICPKEVNDG